MNGPIDFEPTSVGHPSRLPVLVVVLAAAAVVAFAVAGRTNDARGSAATERASTPASPAIADARATSVAPKASAGGTARSRPALAGSAPDPTHHVHKALSLPASVQCEDDERAWCIDVARSALAALPDDAPPIISVSVWHSLLCDSLLDCPPDRLRGALPLGSVVIDLADEDHPIWVDVVEHPGIGHLRPDPGSQFEAWIVPFA